MNIYVFKLTNVVHALKFTVLHGLSPDYISDLLHNYIPVRPLRSAGQSLLTPTTFSTKFYGQRAFNFMANSLWNDLPVHIRQADSLLIFKALLKTHLSESIFV